MKKTLTYIAIPVTSFALAFATSMLLDIPWIQKQWSRGVMVLLIMAAQIIIGILVLRQSAKKNINWKER